MRLISTVNSRGHELLKFGHSVVITLPNKNTTNKLLSCTVGFLQPQDCSPAYYEHLTKCIPLFTMPTGNLIVGAKRCNLLLGKNNFKNHRINRILICHMNCPHQSEIRDVFRVYPETQMEKQYSLYDLLLWLWLF